MPPADSPSAPEPDAWDRDDWKNDAWARDDWARDDWKQEDWGEPAAPRGEGAARPKKEGLAAYNAGMIEAGPYLTVGLQIAFAMLFFVGLGYGADRLFGSSPWGIVIGSALGFVGVMMLIVRMAREANAAAAEQRPPSGSGV